MGFLFDRAAPGAANGRGPRPPLGRGLTTRGSGSRAWLAGENGATGKGARAGVERHFRRGRWLQGLDSLAGAVGRIPGLGVKLAWSQDKKGQTAGPVAAELTA